ncbi:MAG: leukotriene A4 hydrolase C-terminal domain-containing protein, partial [Bacteroidota bacterium]|nr:leukotriene A4 hydrolase C-terminal domain-containing protein [Bacteroidota bacterium]
PSIELTKAWSTHEWLHYLRGIKTITASDMAQLNSHLHLNDNKNREIQFEWYKMGINNDYKPAINLVNPFLLEVGRGKFVTPLYLALIATGKKELAIEIYQATNAHYHPVVQARLKTIFQNI